MINSQSCAFPADSQSQTDGGLTKMEYIATHLMQGLLSGADRHSQDGDCGTWNYENLSKISVTAATVLLIELEKQAK